MRLTFLICLAFATISLASSAEYTCSSEVIPDLDGAWVCDDTWLVSYGEDTSSDYEDLRKWDLYFKLPKFYAVSKIAIQTSPCDGEATTVLRLSAAVWDERFEKVEHEDLATAASKSHWTPVDIKNMNFEDNGIQEYSGFARRAPYWKLTIETQGVTENCIPKIMFFARAGIAAMQHYKMKLDFPDVDESSTDSEDYANAPTGNTCNRVTSVPSEVVSRYRLDTSFYRKYTSAYGIPVMSSSRVDDRALQRACYVVRFMMADRRDVRDHMYRNKGRVAIIGRRETVPMVPEMRQYTWWTRRAAGGTFHNPVNVGAEENMLCERGDGYARNQDIFMHEFAHGIHLIACHTAIRGFNSRLQQSFNYARSRGLWTNTYANTDNREYFAEGVQAYFEQQREGPVGGDGIQNHINTRAELKRHDPILYKIIDELFPCYNDYIPRCNDISQSKGLGQNLQRDCKEGGRTTTVAPTTTTNPETCSDDDQSCAQWAASGECEKNSDIMLFICKKSCKVCTTKTPGTTNPPTTTKQTTSPSTTKPCIDENESCSYWAGIGECEKNPEYMKDKCRKSCDSCSGETTTTTTTIAPTTTTTITKATTTTSPTPCTDEIDSCATWAKDGECKTNEEIMLIICMKSCNACSIIPPGTTNLPTTTKQTTSSATTTTTTPAPTATTSPPKECVDENGSCSFWANIGECEKNPEYMKDKCRKSCRVCTGSSCSDQDRQCRGWRMYCSNNVYVKTNCKKTCGTC